MTITATYIKPIQENSYTAFKISISYDATADEWAALPKSITKNWRPGYATTIDMRPTKGNPVNEAGGKKIARILDTLNIVDGGNPFNASNVCTREEFREYHGI